MKYSTLLRATGVLVFVGLTVFIADVGDVIRQVAHIPLVLLGLLLLLSIVANWLTGLRWQLLNPDPTGQLKSWDYFQLVMIAGSFSLIMPGALGGDVAKVAMAVKILKHRRVDNLIAIVVDRILGLSSIVILGAIAMLFMTTIPNRQPFVVYFSLVGLGMAAAIMAVVSPVSLSLLESLLRRFGKLGQRLIGILDSWRQALLFFRGNWHRVLIALALCLPIHGLSFVTLYVLAQALGIEISFFDVTMVLTIVWVITAIPISISGAGVRELSMIYFLGLYGVTAESATALSLLFFLIMVLLGLAGMVFLFPYLKLFKTG
jgi:uncharacterized protein (TIRG00374 family)